jgi:RNA polymerase sigma factor (sigma-70 family)
MAEPAEGAHLQSAYAFTSHDRDDLFQEIATHLWESIPRFRGESAVTTWLYRVALNSALNWSRKERKHRDRIAPLGHGEPALMETPQVKNHRLALSPSSCSTAAAIARWLRRSASPKAMSE